MTASRASFRASPSSLISRTSRSRALRRPSRKARRVRHHDSDKGCCRARSSGRHPGRHDDHRDHHGCGRVRIRRITRRTALALIIGGDVLLLVLGWFLLVSPQRSTAASIARAALATEVQVQEASRPAPDPSTVTQPKQPEIQTAYLYKLSKAMPMTTDMPNLLLELSQVVQGAGVQLNSISPSPADLTGKTGITLSVSGDFYSLTDLLYRLRNLVTVRDGVLDVSGRLFSVSSVGLTPNGVGRKLDANIFLNAYTFSDAAASAAAVPGATPASTDTTSTSTGSTTTTAPSASADVTP